MFDIINEKFKKFILETNTVLDGKQIILKFDNNYGASCVNHTGSYGNEIAVILFDGKNDWNLCYSTPITDDVLGYLEESEIENVLNSIKELED